MSNSWPQLAPASANGNNISSYSIAGIYSALGQKEPAFEWLYKACEAHDVQLVSLKVDPTLDQLRSDPRFTGLVRRVGLSH